MKLVTIEYKRTSLFDRRTWMSANPAQLWSQPMKLKRLSRGVPRTLSSTGNEWPFCLVEVSRLSRSKGNISYLCLSRFILILILTDKYSISIKTKRDVRTWPPLFPQPRQVVCVSVKVTQGHIGAVGHLFDLGPGDTVTLCTERHCSLRFRTP